MVGREGRGERSRSRLTGSEAVSKSPNGVFFALLTAHPTGMSITHRGCVPRFRTGGRNSELASRLPICSNQRMLIGSLRRMQPLQPASRSSMALRSRLTLMGGASPSYSV